MILAQTNLIIVILVKMMDHDALSVKMVTLKLLMENVQLILVLNEINLTVNVLNAINNNNQD